MITTEQWIHGDHSYSTSEIIITNLFAVGVFVKRNEYVGISFMREYMSWCERHMIRRHSTCHVLSSKYVVVCRVCEDILQ